MPPVLRMQVEKALTINSEFLDPTLGCGQALSRAPRHEANEVFADVMRKYDYPNLHADKPAALVLDESEELMRSFCRNAEANSAPLKTNFREVYAPQDIILVLDKGRHAAYFLRDPEYKTAMTNYFRDAMPGIARVQGLTIAGSPGRLTPVGWQNLHDVVSDINFKVEFPAVARIEIAVGIPTARWNAPVLEVGVPLLNFSDIRTVRQSIASRIVPKPA